MDDFIIYHVVLLNTYVKLIYQAQLLIYMTI